MDILQGITLGQLTPAALVGIAILMVLTGKLWTNPAYQQKVQECDKWQAAYEKEREARQVSDAQTVELLELARTTHSFMTAVFYNSERIKQSGEPDAVSQPTP